MNNKVKIPWARPDFWGGEKEMVMDALDSKWISGGRYVEQFEEHFARYIGAEHAVTASNGTTAIHLALLAAEIGKNDEVIVPGFGFMAAANVAVHVGAFPVFADVDPDTWCLSGKEIEKHISPRTKAIVPIHTYGNVCDMDAIMEVANRLGIMVIEDAAEAIGSKYKGKSAGTIGIMGTYSFHATKTITTGEGGAVTTDDEAMYRRMQLFRNHGVGAKRYWHEVIGHNFRLTNMQAALGCAQLNAIDEISEQRDRVYNAYKRNLSTIEGVTLQRFSADVEPVVWAIAVKLDPQLFPMHRDQLIRKLNELGIETRPGFHAASEMKHLYATEQLPVCELLSKQVVSLPSFPMLSDNEIEYICVSLEKLGRS